MKLPTWKSVWVSLISLWIALIPNGGHAGPDLSFTGGPLVDGEVNRYGGGNDHCRDSLAQVAFIADMSDGSGMVLVASQTCGILEYSFPSEACTPYRGGIHCIDDVNSLKVNSRSLPLRVVDLQVFDPSDFLWKIDDAEILGVL